MSAGQQSSDDRSVPDFVADDSLLDRPVLPAEWLQDLSPDFAHTAQRIMRGIERGDSPVRLLQMLETVMNQAGRSAAETAHALFLLPYLIEQPDELLTAWELTARWSTPFADEPEVRNLRAAVAGEFRMVIDEWADEATGDMEEGLDALRDALPSLESIEADFEASVRLAPESVTARLRAASWYIDQDRLVDAMRLLREASRLDPSHPLVALRFSECARLVSRLDEAREVLLACLRERENPEVLLEAAIVCGETRHWDESIGLAERYEARQKRPLWARYLRAVGCYELERWDEALADIERERVVLQDDEDFHLVALTASVLLRQGSIEAGRAAASAVLSQSWADTTNLPEWSLMEVLTRLWVALETSDQNDLAIQLTRRSVVAGIALPDLFQRQRESERERTGLRVHEVTVQQPLPENWLNHPGCLPDEEEWTGYEVTWEVLAVDTDDAINRVLEWQTIDQPEPPVIKDVRWTGETRDDRPGILLQGKRVKSEE
ncbi:MAG: tetratricopeptide repeat protein [Planctomycetales bacterium]|nr:tetratricopeptide repeat protein [Planctomycetales bacterium]